MKKSSVLMIAVIMLLSSCGTFNQLASSADNQKFSDGIYASSPSFRSKDEKVQSKAETDALIAKTKESSIYLFGDRKDTIMIPDNYSATIKYDKTLGSTVVTVGENPYDWRMNLNPWSYYTPYSIGSSWYWSRHWSPFWSMSPMAYSYGWYDPWYYPYNHYPYHYYAYHYGPYPGYYYPGFYHPSFYPSPYYPGYYPGHKPHHKPDVGPGPGAKPSPGKGTYYGKRTSGGTYVNVPRNGSGTTGRVAGSATRRNGTTVSGNGTNNTTKNTYTNNNGNNRNNGYTRRPSAPTTTKNTAKSSTQYKNNNSSSYNRTNSSSTYRRSVSSSSGNYSNSSGSRSYNSSGSSGSSSSGGGSAYRR